MYKMEFADLRNVQDQMKTFAMKKMNADRRNVQDEWQTAVPWNKRNCATHQMIRVVVHMCWQDPTKELRETDQTTNNQRIRGSVTPSATNTSTRASQSSPAQFCQRRLPPRRCRPNIHSVWQEPNRSSQPVHPSSRKNEGASYERRLNSDVFWLGLLVRLRQHQREER